MGSVGHLFVCLEVIMTLSGSSLTPPLYSGSEVTSVGHYFGNGIMKYFIKAV